MLISFYSSTFLKFLLLGVTFFLWLGPTTSSHAAEPQLERIWDHDLKRWLTPKELGHMEIYFTEDEAAKVMFPDSESIRRETLTLTAEQKELVEQRIGWKFPETSFPVYLGETQGKIDGYAIVQNTIGKHRPITYMVGVDEEGEVANFEVLVYREARGNVIAHETADEPRGREHLVEAEEVLLERMGCLRENQCQKRVATARLHDASAAAWQLTRIQSEHPGPSARTGYAWRRGRDSNPRRACALNGFQDRRFRPLSHLSMRQQHKPNAGPPCRATGRPEPRPRAARESSR